MKFRKFKTSEEEKKFFTTLRKRVHKKLENKYSKYGGASFWFKGVFWIAKVVR